MDVINLFEGSYSNLDGDLIDYAAAPIDPPDPTDEYSLFAIGFTDLLPPLGEPSEENLPQSGMITARVKSDVPDGTVIEGIFVYVPEIANLNIPYIGNFLTKKARADDFTDFVDTLDEQGSVRVQVTRLATVLTLPRTGSSINTSNTGAYIGIAVIGALVGISTIKIKKVVKAKANK